MEARNRKILVYRPAQIWLAAGIAALLLAAAGWWLFELGGQQAGTELAGLQQERDGLHRSLEQLQEELMALRERLAVLQRSSEIDRQASIEVRNDFARLQGELLGLRKELEFYRGIVSPADAKPGLRIQNFELTAGSPQGVYEYDLTVTQVQRNDRYVSGVIELEIHGVEHGKPRRLSLAALAPAGVSSIAFRFRYFQRFEGRIHLPDGFQPQSVRLRVLPRGKGKPPAVEETIDWPV
jgi:hypothetical protein